MALRHLRGLAIGVTLLATAVLAGCGGSDTTDPEPTPDTISGQYLFRTANGTPAPFGVVLRPGLDPSTFEFTGGSMTLFDNGTDGGVYRIEWVGHWVGRAGSQTEVRTGTYLRHGVDGATFRCDSLCMTYPASGKIEAGRVTLFDAGPIMAASGRNTQVQLSSPLVEGPPWTFVWER